MRKLKKTMYVVTFKDATKKCLIKLNLKFKISNRTRLELDKLVATDMIFS
jgi:hypothetical protein